MSIQQAAKSRYTTKVFDGDFTLAQDKIDEIKTLLQMAPSSVNSQPWHFVIAATAEGKARIAKAAVGSYAYSEPKILKASHVVVLCSKTSFDDAYMEQLLNQDDASGRFANADLRAAQNNSRAGFVKLHNEQLHDTQHWMEKQVYLALGTLLLGASALGVDACPMEGFDRDLLNKELGLTEQGFTSVVLVALGKRSADDFNAPLPKSRHTAEQIFTEI